MRVVGAMVAQVAGLALVVTAATLAFGLVGLTATVGAALYLLGNELAGEDDA